MALKLSKHVFLTLAALRRTKGAAQLIDPDGLARAARGASLTPEELAEVERDAQQSEELDATRVEGMSSWDRLVTYALAAWLTQLGEARNEGTQTTYHAFWGVRALLTLGDALSLPPAARMRLAAVTYEIARLPDGARPEAYDFQSVATELVERMPQGG